MTTMDALRAALPQENNDADGGALVVIQPATALTVFSVPGAIAPVLAGIRGKIDAFSADVETSEGRKAIRAFAYKITRSKTYLDAVGKEVEAEQRKIPLAIAAARKEITATLDSWADAVRKPLTEWEEAEKARAAALKAALDRVRGAPAACAGRTSTEIAAVLDSIRAIDPADEAFGEHSKLAATLKDNAVDALERALTAAQEQEATAAELARLRREIEERAAADRAAAAERERLAAEQAKAEAAATAQREAEERARVRAEAAAQAAALAERDAAAKREAAIRAECAQKERLAAAEAQREADERKAREADVAHRATINRTALDALVAEGLSVDDGKTVLKAIVAGRIPAVSIAY